MILGHQKKSSGLVKKYNSGRMCGVDAAGRENGTTSIHQTAWTGKTQECDM